MDLTKCKLCPRNCGLIEQKLLILCANNMKIARADLHLEKPCISVNLVVYNFFLFEFKMHILPKLKISVNILVRNKH